ncbi:MAG: hypothetical protein V4660_04955 [Pseudomonadota bacterium]
MVISNFVSYSALGLGAIQRQGVPVPGRQALTLDAKLDPNVPNEYAVELALSDLAAPVIEPPQKTSEAKPGSKKLNQNKDPASLAFISIADFKSATHKIDIHI